MKFGRLSAVNENPRGAFLPMACKVRSVLLQTRLQNILQHCGIELCYLLISLDGIIAYVGNKQSEMHNMTRRQPAVSGPVLIVEDDKNTASLVAVYLEKEGFKAIQAYDGRQALELARLHNPVLIILDLMLPKMDGLEV